MFINNLIPKRAGVVGGWGGWGVDLHGKKLQMYGCMNVSYLVCLRKIQCDFIHVHRLLLFR